MLICIVILKCSDIRDCFSMWCALGKLRESVSVCYLLISSAAQDHVIKPFRKEDAYD